MSCCALLSADGLLAGYCCDVASGQHARRGCHAVRFPWFLFPFAAATNSTQHVEQVRVMYAIVVAVLPACCSAPALQCLRVVLSALSASLRIAEVDISTTQLVHVYCVDAVFAVSALGDSCPL